ncbi:hypothetical protein DFH06DRAFT_1153728 [Mycena polygramma]|nr:hypothetical protein DFH06DRAFT_1153728 [Mycena polygramma]
MSALGGSSKKDPWILRDDGQLFRAGTLKPVDTKAAREDKSRKNPPSLINQDTPRWSKATIAARANPNPSSPRRPLRILPNAWSSASAPPHTKICGKPSSSSSKPPRKKRRLTLGCVGLGKRDKDAQDFSFYRQIIKYLVLLNSTSGTLAAVPIFDLLVSGRMWLEAARAMFHDEEDDDIYNVEDLYVERIALQYPDNGTRDLTVLYFPPEDVTLGDAALLDTLIHASPSACSTCSMPHFRLEALAGVSFTAVPTCPHHSNCEQLLPNQTIARLLPAPSAADTCHGALFVFKHEHPAGDLLDNRDLPLIDVVNGDILHIDEWVIRWILEQGN